MTAVDMAKLNRPGVMSSYSSSGRKNTVHGSKSTVVGSTFNQARMTAATKFLSPSKGGHVSARIMAENSAPRYLSGSETAIIANRDSGQVTSLQSGTSIFGVGARMMMPSMPMGGMSTGGVLGFLAGTAGAAILNKVLSPGAQAQVASTQQSTQTQSNGAKLDNALNGLGRTALSVNYSGMTINSDTNLPDANSFGATFENDFNSISSALSGDFDATKISADVDSLVTNADSDFANAQANYNILTERQGKVLNAERDLSEKKTDAQNKADTAQEDLSSKESTLKSNTEARDRADELLSAQDETYKNVSNALKSAEGEKSAAQDKVSTCSDALGAAEADLSNAEANVDAARTAYANATPEQKAAADAALSNAEANLSKAKMAKADAEKDLKEAKATLEKLDEKVSDLQSQKDSALKNLENSRKDLQTFITQCKTAEKAVRNSQKNVDSAKTNFDNCNRELLKLDAQQNSANGVKAQFGQYQSKLETLKSNADRAHQLKEQVDKAIADKKPAESQHK